MGTLTRDEILNTLMAGWQEVEDSKIIAAYFGDDFVSEQSDPNLVLANTVEHECWMQEHDYLPGEVISANMLMVWFVDGSRVDIFPTDDDTYNADVVIAVFRAGGVS